MDTTALSAELIRDEGVKLKPYKDSVGILTIGVGRNLEAVGVNDEEVHVMLANDITRTCADLDRVHPWWRELDEVRQRVVANMAFNLGVKGFSGFVNTISAIKGGHYKEAAAGMRQSRWATQVGERAVRLAKMMETGGV